MCGLAGYLAFHDPGVVDEATLLRMRDTMVHRGPDGAGHWISPDRRVGLAHRRLSIIDLSTSAAQPFGSEDGVVQVAFNGEIYNHAEIRESLRADGVTHWRTDHSDTEVILRAYERWGIACLERFRGMFAIAIWDGRSRDLWLVRDRIGIKPLYWAQHDGRIIFASEIKALLEDRALPRRVHHDALFHYLSFLTTPAPQTLFDGVRKLPGGCLLRVTESGAIEERRWWNVWDGVQPLTGRSDAAIAEMVLDELRTAVRLRKVSDVPVGVFLSGGIDSSTNAALFSEGESRPVQTFCIGYSGSSSYANETHFARQMAEQVGAEHHELLLTVDDLMEFIPRMIDLQDEPIADPVCVPVHFVSKLARDNGVVVAQVGEGSDELFWGYQSWKTWLKLARWNALPVPRFAKSLALAGVRGAGKGLSMHAELLRRGASGQPIFYSGAEAFGDAEKHALLHHDLRREFAGRTSWEALKPLHDDFLTDAWEPSHLHWMTHSDLHLRLPELLLMRVDKMSMGVSLEGRVPFLDHRFVQLALSIPTDVKIRGGVSKTILKQAVRGLIPDQLIDRPKQGFGVPVHEWFMTRLGGEIRTTLDRFCDDSGLLDRHAVRAVLDRGDGTRAWYLYNLAAWWERYIA